MGRNEPIEHALAIRLPQGLRETSALTDSEFEFCIFTDLNPYDLVRKAERWPAAGWLSGSLADIADIAETLTVSKRLINESLELLEKAVRAASDLMGQATDLDFIGFEHGFSQVLQQRAGTQTTRMAMVIIANALAFHDTISAAFDVPSVSSIRSDPETSSLMGLRTAWRKIMYGINYWPIFHVADQLLDLLNERWGGPVIDALADATQKLAHMGITTWHDVVGKMFQSLIVDRKFLATFYTRPTSAALISELAIGRLRHNWKDLTATISSE
ncbi:MAG: hypothetical protein OXM02_04940 [Bacteroidota bacterium]|nr:hypothetical protein [Bacteroidota bacterium]